jgi:hemerythrin
MLAWGKELILGNEQMDKEHKHFIEQVNELYHAVERLNSKEEAMKTLEFLKNYVHEHFEHEEKFQIEIGYPGYKEHHQIHETYKKEVLAMVKDHESREFTGPERIELFKNVMRWIADHINKEDRKIVDYINKK